MVTWGLERYPAWRGGGLEGRGGGFVGGIGAGRRRAVSGWFVDEAKESHLRCIDAEAKEFDLGRGQTLSGGM